MEVPSDVSVQDSPAAEPIEWDRELDEVEHGLAQIERALVRLDDGTYGTCEVCAIELDDDLLHAAPTASRCRDHA